MKKTAVILFLFLCSPLFLYAQKFYFKPEVRFHHQLTTQASPRYFSASLFFPGGSPIQISAETEKFSLANGVSYGGVLGYNFSEVFSLELGIDYFRNKKTVESESFNPSSFSSNWLFNSINATPSVVLNRTLGKFYFSARFGGIIGISAIDKTIQLNDARKTYKLRGNMSVGYMFGIECGYKLNQFLALEAGIGVENIFYTPARGTLTEDDFSYTGLDNLPTYVKEINYVRKLDYQEGRYSDYYNLYYLEYDKPSVQLAETVKLNSVYFEIGLRYNFQVHEKN